jgi:hypothetical protein
LPPSRAHKYLADPPSDPAELAGFPAHVLPVGGTTHRIHRTDLGAWYFNADDKWRFNPCSVAGLGACYLAERAVAGLLEVFKGFKLVDGAELRERSHFSAVLDRDLRLADCCAAEAAAFGVDGEIHSTTDYELTQRWASAFAAADFAGVRYLCRSDPRMRLVGYALFDSAGEAPAGSWPAGVDRPISDEIVREAEPFGLRFRSAPEVTSWVSERAPDLSPGLSQ